MLISMHGDERIPKGYPYHEHKASETIPYEVILPLTW